jgi:hypothetical protein
MTLGGLPHSEIPVSSAASASTGPFAAWPRPSSAPSAKASTVCPSLRSPLWIVPRSHPGRTLRLGRVGPIRAPRYSQWFLPLRRPHAGRSEVVITPADGAAGPFTCQGTWWSRGGSNPEPPPCKGGALPVELRPRPVGAPGLEPGTSALSGPRSNQLSYAPRP